MKETHGFQQRFANRVNLFNEKTFIETLYYYKTQIYVLLVILIDPCDKFSLQITLWLKGI